MNLAGKNFPEICNYMHTKKNTNTYISFQSKLPLKLHVFIIVQVEQLRNQSKPEQ
jgi:hypothetical protein